MMLEKIINNRVKLLKKEKEAQPLDELRKKAERLLESGYSPAPFLKNMKKDRPFLVAEIKKSSPSKGVIREDFNLGEIASAYGSSAHVSAISVLTEPEYFSGNYDYLSAVKEKTAKPVLMKDFILDEYQIYRGFVEGASAVLLIAAVLSKTESDRLSKLGYSLQMNVLFETHTAEEYRRGLDSGFDLIGINNRDLKTFITDINTTVKILDSEGKPGNKTIISESGMKTRGDIETLINKSVNGFLIGERFMKQKNITAAIDELFGK